MAIVSLCVCVGVSVCCFTFSIQVSSNLLKLSRHIAFVSQLHSCELCPVLHPSTAGHSVHWCRCHRACSAYPERCSHATQPKMRPRVEGVHRAWWVRRMWWWAWAPAGIDSAPCVCVAAQSSRCQRCSTGPAETESQRKWDLCKKERERESRLQLTMGSERELEIMRNWSNKEAMNRLSYQRKQEWTALDPLKVVASEGQTNEPNGRPTDQVWQQQVQDKQKQWEIKQRQFSAWVAYSPGCLLARLAIALRCACFTFSAVQHAACHINKPQVEAETGGQRGQPMDSGGNSNANANGRNRVKVPPKCSARFTRMRCRPVHEIRI